MTTPVRLPFPITLSGNGVILREWRPEDLNPADNERCARAWARKDASPPRSGRDELTSGLGDREVAERPGSARLAAVADVQESCSSDAPSNCNPDPLPPAA